jgi:putative tributyrin esterase
MAVCTLHYFSKAIAKMSGATVIVPEGEGMVGPFPTFYLLHGFSDDFTAWSRRTNVERYAETLPFIIVMPDGGHGFYIDAQQGYAYDAAITQDLLPLIDRTFQTDPRRQKRVVGGLSMGGYGAIKLALAHPDLFSGAVSHSGALAWAHRPLTAETEWGRGAIRLVGENPQGGPHDLFALAAKIDRDRLPALRIDCGVDDFLIEDNRLFHQHLEKLGIPHEYAEYPGGHTWAYWDEHVQEALAFHARAIGLSG